MEVELVRFVGAGLGLALSSLDKRVPLQAVSGGFELIKELSERRPDGLSALIGNSAREICRTWRLADIPDAVAAHHVDCLPPILQAHGDRAHPWASALPDLLDGGGPAAVMADRLAEQLTKDIVAAAAASGELDAQGLTEPASEVLIEALLRSVSVNIAVVQGLAPVIEEVFAFEGDEELPAAGGLEAALVLISRDACSRALLETLVEEDRAKGRDDAEIEASLESKACACQELLGELRRLQREQFDGADMRHAQTLIEKLDAGDIGGFEALLAGLEECEAAVDTDEPGQSLAGELRYARARLDEVRERWQAAAGHYAGARNYRPSFDVKGRWRLMMRQASALVQHGMQCDDIKALFEAAQVHAEAGGLLQEQDAPLEWASAHVQLGNLLLTLAEREDRPERYLAAALHFKPAVDVFSREGAMEDWAVAQLGLAKALKGQGEFQGDPVTLGDAVFAYRAALGTLHAGRSPAEWSAAQAGLGESLVRIAEETGQSGLVDEAVAALKCALASMTPSGRSRLEGALGRAYVVQAAERDDASALSEGVGLIERVLASDGPAMRQNEIAMLNRQLGTALWALAEAAGDKARLESALNALTAARNAYSAVGDATAVSHIGKDITNVKIVLARLRHSNRRSSDHQLQRAADRKA